MMVIASTVSFLPVQEARASIELAYDNATVGGWVGNIFSGVRFSLPGGISEAKLLTIRFVVAVPNAPYKIHITGVDHVTELVPVIDVTSSPASAYPAVIFTNIDVAALDIVVTGDFFVIVEQINIPGYTPYFDLTPSVGRSYWGNTLAGLALDPGNYNLVIRVVIDPIGTAVGGVVLPTNKLTLVTPYLALAGLIVVVSTVVVVRRRQPD
jgi:hypothetical protein